MLSLSASPTSSSVGRRVRSEEQFRRPIQHIRHVPVGLSLRSIASPAFVRQNRTSLMKSASIICASTMSATCSAEQTQTITRPSSTITIAPKKVKEKSPELDNRGTGLPPRNNGDGGGGGGGGGGWSGGWFLFAFLCLLGLLKNNEEEGPHGSRE